MRRAAVTVSIKGHDVTLDLMRSHGGKEDTCLLYTSRCV